MVYKCFDKKTGSCGVKTKFVGVTNHQLANKLHNPIIKNSKTKNVILILIILFESWLCKYATCK